MEMMECPKCGAQNSVKRDFCYECQQPLRGEAAEQPLQSKAASPPQEGEQRDYVPTCANCAHAAIFPPLGKHLTPNEVWCTEREEVVPAAQIGGDCFSEAFSWKREDILD